MKSKRWRPIRQRISRVEIVSRVDGSMLIRPYWRGAFVFGDVKLPGILTRMGTAQCLEDRLNEALRASPCGWAGIPPVQQRGEDGE